MTKIILSILFLALNVNANITPTEAIETRLTLQEKTLNSKIALQNQAIDNFKTAIKINPNIGKEINDEYWEILSNRIATSDDPKIKQQYQEILGQLKN
jgi:hypothetical protein